MLVDIIILVVVFLVSVVWASFGVIVPLIVLRTGFPLIKALEKDNLINGIFAKRSCYKTLIFWGIIDIIIIILMILFANAFAWIGFGIGLLLALLIGVSKTGPNANNKEDFMRSYGRFCYPETFDKAMATIIAYPLPAE